MRNLNYKIYLFLFLTGISVSGAHAAVDSKQIAEAFIVADFKKVAGYVQCPRSYTEKQVNEERAMLQREIKYLSGKFGVPKSYEYTNDYVHTSLVLGCGKPDDHVSLNPTRNDVYIITYDSEKKAILRVFYVLKGVQEVVGLIGIGEAKISPSSIKRQTDLYKELKE